MKTITRAAERLPQNQDKGRWPQPSAHAFDHAHQTSDLIGGLYRFHGFRVLARQGEHIGRVDWLWAHESGHAEFIGIGLQWLRGKARAVPVQGAMVDIQTGTIRVPFTRDQVRRAPRHAIDRDLSLTEKRDISARYKRTYIAEHGRAVAERLAA